MCGKAGLALLDSKHIIKTHVIHRTLSGKNKLKNEGEKLYNLHMDFNVETINTLFVGDDVKMVSLCNIHMVTNVEKIYITRDVSSVQRFRNVSNVS